jgi:hypothetical protein
MKKTILICGLLLTTLSFGCASIMCGESKTVNISSNPSEAHFKIKNKNGQEVTTGTTPTNINLKRGRGFFAASDYTIELSKTGYLNKNMQIKQILTPWYVLGNFAFGGIIGWFFVDPLTGAMWDIEDINTNLEVLPIESIQNNISIPNTIPPYIPPAETSKETRKIIGYQATTDPKTVKIVTYPVYENSR